MGRPDGCPVPGLPKTRGLSLLPPWAIVKGRMLRETLKAASVAIRHQNWDDVTRFNSKASPQALEMLGWATNRPASAPHGALAQRGDLFLFGGTGCCGNRWPAPAGGWYPIAAVWRIPRRGKGKSSRPRLVAVVMDWY